MSTELPEDYLRIPPTYNMGWDVCDKWIERGHGKEICIYYGDQKLTWDSLYDLSNRAANGLSKLGVSVNGKFIIRCHNRPESLASMIAGWRLGAVPIPVNTLFRPRELEFIVNNSEAVVFLTSQEYSEPLKQVMPRCPGLKHVIFFGEQVDGGMSFADLVNEPGRIEMAETSSNDHAFSIYTSGTTAEPKGVTHAHRWLIATGDPVGKIMMKLSRDDIVMHPQEFSFIYATGCGFLYPLRVGSKIVVYPGRATTEKVYEYIQNYRVNVLCTVPTMYRMLLAVKDAEKKYDLSSLKRCISAGETLPAPTYEEWKTRFGCQIFDGLGQTEIHIFTAEHPAMKVKAGSCGKPFPGYEVKVLDEEGKDCPPGRVGQIAIKEDNPGLFFSYYKNPAKWKETHRDGWYLTSDMGYMDEEGYLWYAGRADDMIKSRAYLISPKEVEETILEHPSVLEAGVVGIPDELMGSRVKAFIVLRPSVEGSDRLRDEVIAHVKSRIAPYKVPKEIEFTKELPKTATGKILRRELRARLVDAKAT